MKLDFNNLDWDEFEELPSKEKIIKKKSKDLEEKKEYKSKKTDTYKKKRGKSNEDI